MSFIMCVKENLELLNEASNISKVYNTAVSLLKKEMKPYPAFSKGSFKKDEDYKGFINDTEEYTMIYYCSLWDAIKHHPRTPEGGMEADNEVWIPLRKILENVNKKLPKGYNVTADYGDWDDIAIHLEKN